MVNGLRSLALDDLGLAGAIEQLLTEEKARAGWTGSEFIHNVAGQRFHKLLETTVYRVAQEALTNARKHAKTERVQLTLITQCRDGIPLLVLEAQDWGIGFVPDQRSSDHAHVGIQSMSERVSLLGGEYELSSSPGTGTLIRAVLPALEPGKEGDE